ncbi:hypothetical protein D3C74_437710 [compost metagenome]
MAQVAEMDADLVRPPGLQLHLQHSAASQDLAAYYPRHRSLTARRDPPACRMMAVAANGRIDQLQLGRHGAFYDRRIQS